MNKQKWFYSGAAVIAIIVIASILYFKKEVKKDLYIPLKERKGKANESTEWKSVKLNVEELINQIKANDKDEMVKLKLSKIYLEEARITGDHAYYDGPALSLLDNVLAANPTQFEALCFKSSLLLSQHHFAEGLEEAKKAQKVYNNKAFVYGLLCDGNVELGNYEQAIKDGDQMVAIKPDLTSYSRVSYLREIHGDIPGAIAAMKLAAEAGVGGQEGTSWCRTFLGRLYELNGDTQSARRQYLITISQRPEYAGAYAGLGRLEKMKLNFPQSMAYFQQADSLIEDYSYKIEIADIYLIKKDEINAKKYTQKAIDQLIPNITDPNNLGHGHYADRELANCYAVIGNYDKALEHAIIEYNRRPNNIDVNETMAWVKYLKGEVKEANTYIDVALKTNSKNPTLLIKAAIIKSSNNLIKESEMLESQAQTGINTVPYFVLSHLKSNR